MTAGLPTRRLAPMSLFHRNGRRIPDRRLSNRRSHSQASLAVWVRWMSSSTAGGMGKVDVLIYNGLQ
jgi:hypothetical protein